MMNFKCFAQASFDAIAPFQPLVHKKKLIIENKIIAKILKIRYIMTSTFIKKLKLNKN